MSAGQQHADPQQLLAGVVAATRIQEGDAGVRAILRAYRGQPSATRTVSRATRLPVPVVASVAGELRKLGLLSESKPSTLTPAGHELLATLGMSEIAVPPRVAEVAAAGAANAASGAAPWPADLAPAFDRAVARLTELMVDGPAADLALDQSHCTPQTKVRRVQALLQAGVLPGADLLLIGDDDLISLAIGVVGDELGQSLVKRLAVVDISAEILGFVAERSAAAGWPIETVRHDLREPLPIALRGGFDAAMTDPPYTAPGARLFLTRCIEGLRAGAGRSIFFSFGAKAPDEMLLVQRAITDLGLVSASLEPNFNEYLGSGILAGVGQFQHLITTSVAADSPALKGAATRHEGPLYTRELRPRARHYTCAACGDDVLVGAGEHFESIAALRDHGCPACGQGPFRPGQLVAEVNPIPVPEATAAVQVRPAGEADLDAIAAFEVTIAEVSFGDVAVTDAGVHRDRVAKAMARSALGMYVAVDASGRVVGWLWMAANTNAFTGDRYANFRSLATTSDGGEAVAEVLLAAGLAFAAEQGLAEIVGKVAVSNLRMRTLYRKFGFEAVHQTMRLRTGQ